jgi:hypothetical protein
MEKIKKLFSGKVFKILKWIFLVLLALYLIVVVVRVFQMFGDDRTEVQVEKIHATKLQLSDVMGDNLPPDPGPEADKTVEGIDANENGIRDDVELAVFKEYPNSAKTRAVLLQYALVLQMQMTLPLVNKETMTATVEDRSRALNCIWSITSRENMQSFLEITEKNENLIEELQLNTEQRKNRREAIYEYLGSYTASRESCDIDLVILSN